MGLLSLRLHAVLSKSLGRLISTYRGTRIAKTGGSSEQAFRDRERVRVYIIKRDCHVASTSLSPVVRLRLYTSPWAGTAPSLARLLSSPPTCVSIFQKQGSKNGELPRLSGCFAYSTTFLRPRALSAYLHQLQTPKVIRTRVQ